MNKTYSREFEASPTFQWTNGAISDSNIISVSWETYNTTSKKYLPFNFTRIVNNGEDDIYFYPNQDTNKSIYVPKGSIMSIDESTIPALSSFSLKRAGTTNITASKIFITNSRQGQTSDSIVSRLHKRLFARHNSRVV